MKKIIFTIFSVLQFSGAFAQYFILYSDTINFEEPCNYLTIDNSGSNLWQIGIPSKTILDTAYSTPYAIITDTSEYYTANNHSIFTLKLEPESFGDGGNTEINFWHKFDTDSISDYGVVEVSYDEGNEWKVLRTDTTYLIDFTRNDSFTASHLATGQSNGWVNDLYCFRFYLASGGEPENIWLRFSFYSDGQENDREGWMIDNIRITQILPWGIEENNLFYSYPYPNPCQSVLNILIPDNEYKHITLYIWDNYGRLIVSELLENKQIRLTTGQLKNGLYFYTVLNNGNKSKSYGKFIIKK